MALQMHVIATGGGFKAVGPWLLCILTVFGVGAMGYLAAKG
jgi:hypothetical protein